VISSKVRDWLDLQKVISKALSGWADPTLLTLLRVHSRLKIPLGAPVPNAQDVEESFSKPISFHYFSRVGHSLGIEKRIRRCVYFLTH
jgi:hypothetical protein